MRVTAVFLLALVVFMPACSKEKPQPAAEEKDPIFVGDDTAPIEIRTYKKAKEVKKEVEEQQKEQKKILKEGD